MAENKTQFTDASVDDFLTTVSEKRRAEAYRLIAIMGNISGEKPVMYGPSIIGFGKQHYKYATGREGDMPQLAFSPRKSALTIYFNEGVDEQYSELVENLGKYKTSKAYLYVNKLEDIDLAVLEKMLSKSLRA